MRPCAVRRSVAGIKMKRMSFSAVLAGMITVMTAYLCHIPVGVNGGYVHFGDALIFLGAALLPKSYAVGAAVIGSGLAGMVLGIVVGIAGLAGCSVNYPIYKKMLEKGKAKYAYEIVELARQIGEE